MLLLAPSPEIALSLPRVTIAAQASVRIERPATASAKEWEQTPPAGRREMIVRDEKGRVILLRITENE